MKYWRKMDKPDASNPFQISRKVVNLYNPTPVLLNVLIKNRKDFLKSYFRWKLKIRFPILQINPLFGSPYVKLNWIWRCGDRVTLNAEARIALLERRGAERRAKGDQSGERRNVWLQADRLQTSERWEEKEAAENEERRRTKRQESVSFQSFRNALKLPEAFSSLWDMKGIAVAWKSVEQLLFLQSFSAPQRLIFQPRPRRSQSTSTDPLKKSFKVINYKKRLC